MKNLIINTSRSIRSLNYLLFLFLININAIFYIFDELNHFDYIYLFINLIILSVFFILNKIFENEYNTSKLDIKTLNGSILDGKNSNIKELLLKKISFKENEDIYKLFRENYIKKNLIAKDFEDLKLVFNKFIPEKFLKIIGEKGTDKITLGLSVKKHLNVMFLDIIGFTSMAETISPNKTLTLLNIYFDGIVEIIKKNGGYVDKFLGDGMMVIFDNLESDIIIKTSIEIQKFMKKMQISELGKNIRVGIGINSGNVILGTIGSNNRMEITIIGDVVNTASRIEGLTRNNGYNIIISESTYKNLKIPNNYKIIDLGLTSLKGKKSKIKIYGVGL